MSRYSADPPSAEAGAGKREPRSEGTRLLLSRLPVTILVAAYAIVFLIRQLPELAGVRALAQIARQASVLVWSPMPGTGGHGAAGADGVFLLIAIIGAVGLAAVGTRPTVPWSAVRLTVPAVLRAAVGWASLPAGALVVLGLVVRIISVLRQSWSPAPVGGLAFGALAAVTAIFAMREIALAAPADGSPATGESAAGSAVSAGDAGDGGWRGKGWFILIAITWIGDVAIGRYFEPRLITAIAAAPPAKRWDYLGNGASWWLYLLGVLVVIIGYALIQLLPPWDGRARQLVVAVVVIIVAFIAIQQVQPYAHTAVTHLIHHGP
ncbi:MAG: hypothetical protein J2P25_04565 [Nocardiopsaceae bacterium]|nr:hypothetical protein [Nocardiopsaceae bacterium]